jgi:hypothetical protein
LSPNGSRPLQPSERPPHPATVVQPKEAIGAPAARPPHPATVVQPKAVIGAPAGRSPHPATVAQPRPAIGGPAARPPHPAMVVQPKPAFGAPAARPPHPAMVVQPKPAFGAPAARPPHPATVVQPKLAFGAPAARPPHPAMLAASRAPHPATVAQRSAFPSTAGSSAAASAAAAAATALGGGGDDKKRSALTIKDLDATKERDLALYIVGEMLLAMTELKDRLEEQSKNPKVKDKKREDAMADVKVAEDVLASLFSEITTGLDRIARESKGKIDGGTISVAFDKTNTPQGVLLRRWGNGDRSLTIVWLTAAPENLDPDAKSPIRGVGWALVQPMFRDADARSIPILVSPEGQKAVDTYTRWGFVPVPGRAREMMRPSRQVVAAIARHPAHAVALLDMEYGFAMGARTRAERDVAVAIVGQPIDEKRQQAEVFADVKAQILAQHLRDGGLS